MFFKELLAWTLDKILRVIATEVRAENASRAHGQEILVYNGVELEDARLDELVDAARRGGIPLVYVVPQTTGAYWPPDRVLAVVRDALARWPIDPRRIYLTGISDGATGVWDALKAYPRCFAAAVPMSGMTELAGLGPIRDVPQWVFHGDKDDDTDVETGYGGAMVGSRAVVRALRAMGGTPRYTEYANEKHVIWARAYAEPALLPWLLGQRLRGAPCDFVGLAR